MRLSARFTLSARRFVHFSTLSGLLLLAACEQTPTVSDSSEPPTTWTPTLHDGPPNVELNPSSLTDATPRYLPRSRYGNHSPYTVFGKQYEVMEHDQRLVQEGIASWYGTKFHGKRTSSWEPYDMFEMTAAHRELPLPTFVRVTNLENKRTTVVKVNDRGPFHGDRIIDLSYAAAVKLGFAEQGTARVHVEAIPMATLHPVIVNRKLATTTPSPHLQTDTQDRSATVSALEQAKQRYQQTSAKTNQNSSDNSLLGAERHSEEDSAVENQRLYIQVGAFTELERAQQIQKSLAEWVTFPITIQRPQYQGGLHRVRIGPLRNSVQAKAINQLLAKEFEIETPLLVWH